MYGASALIDTAALRANLQVAIRLAPRARCFAVIKANAYGHGIVRVAAALRDRADGFAVARLGEALQLRDAGIDAPILLLEGVLGVDGLRVCARHSLAVAVHHPTQLEQLCGARLSRPLNVWLKIDSGMHRLGFEPQQAAAVWRRLRGSSQVDEIGLFSHFANADDPDDSFTDAQLARFDKAIAGLPGARSLANSAALLTRPDSHADWIRPGLMLYGASPLASRPGSSYGLRPAMTLTTTLIAVKRVAAGETVGYGRVWRCRRATTIGVAAAGYGDGYPRGLPSGTPVLVNGLRTPLVGRVSMDMITVDLGEQPQAGPGDPVVLWGRGLPVEELAAAAGTIPYTLLSGISARVHYHYL